MSAADIISLIASIASLVLAIVAIWLSIVFFKMSSQLSESTKEAAKGIGASVERLEKLFDKLYADTFSMMRDTVSDMRKHIWPDDTGGADKISEEAERKADEKINAIKKEIDKEIMGILRRQKMQDVQLDRVHKEFDTLIERAMLSSRQAESEAREETIREHIMNAIFKLQRADIKITADRLLDVLKFPPGLVIKELSQMKKDKLINWENVLGPDTEIALLKK